jgi:hypothetical protein
MQELELLQQQGWRFCAIAPVDGKPTKGPRTPNWQRTPLTLDQIPAEDNIGVILGATSGGILAIDFDGAWAWDYWHKTITPQYGVDLDAITNTVGWSSGREGRAQFAFRVPESEWSSLPPRFNISGPEDDTGKRQGLEFRWSTQDSIVQSVLPPSVHPDTGKPYFWMNEPSTTPVAVAPEGLLAWGRDGKPEPLRRTSTYQPPTLDTLDQHTLDDVEDLLKKLKTKYFTLEYSTWRNVAWSVYRCIGPAAGLVLMQQYYPEQHAGEYNNLMRGWNAQKSPGIGTLRYMVRDLLALEARQLQAQIDQALLDAVTRLQRKSKQYEQQ